MFIWKHMLQIKSIWIIPVLSLSGRMFKLDWWSGITLMKHHCVWSVHKCWIPESVNHCNKTLYLLETSMREFRSSKQVLVVLKINHGVWHNSTVLVWDQKTAFKSWFFYLRTVLFDKFLKLKFNFITCTIEVMEGLGTIYKLLSSEYS